MAIEFACPTCGGTLRVDDDAAGRDIRCGKCLAVLRVPDAQPGPPPAPAEPPRERPGYDPERRPARRRPPPPPRGRSPLFWVSLVVGGLALGTLTCCGGGYALLPGEKWHRHESPDGGFAVDLPAPAKRDMVVPGMKPDPELKVEGATLWTRGELYVVAYATILPARQRAFSDDGLLDEIARELKSDGGVARVVRDERVTVSGFPAREIEYVYRDGGTYTGRFVVADRRLYTALAGGRFVRPNNANVRRFLDSFAVTDKTLVGGDAFNEQKEAERQAAAREAAHRARENEAFRTTPHTGPTPGDPRALSYVPGDVLYFPYDETNGDRMGRTPWWGASVSGAVSGSGVRRTAAYFTPDSNAGYTPLSVDSTPDRDLPTGKVGFTVSGWFRTRHRGVRLFEISCPFLRDHPSSGATVEVTVNPAGVALRAHDATRTVGVAAPHRPDDRWHHFAVVFKPRGRDADVTIYLDGTKATTEGTMFVGLPMSSIKFGGLTSDILSQLHDVEGKPVAGGKTDLGAALDECCLIDRQLHAGEVRKLAGLEALSLAPPEQVGEAARTPFPVPAATEFPGLKTYFPFDELEGVYVRDAVNGELTARVGGPALIVGPRGTALRTSARLVRHGSRGIDFGHRSNLIGTDVGEEFTLAFWVRTAPGRSRPLAFLRGSHRAPNDGTRYEIQLARESIVDMELLADEKAGLRFKFTSEMTQRESGTGVAGKRPDVKAGVWTHFALSRNEKGEFRWFLNGEGQGVAGADRGPFRFSELALGCGWEVEGSFVADFDELCVFNRELTDDELAALAGQKELPQK